MMAGTKSATSSVDSISIQRIGAALIPYAPIGIGLLVFHNAWIALTGYHLSLVIILFTARRKISFTQIRESRNYKILILTFLMGGLGGLLLYWLWPLLAIPEEINLYLQNIGLTAAVWPFFIAYFVLINPWLEEYFWRGYLGSPSKWITLNDLFFSGYHIIVLAGKIDAIWLIPVFIVLSLGAWFWRQADKWNRGILASIVSHAAADISVILTIYFSAIRV
jgi:membrane protease YdiL (CAAX protease family)